MNAKKKSIKQLRTKLDRVFNEYIRVRDGECIICKTKAKLQCSHYYGKHAHPFLRWSDANAHAMCSRHHFKHHHGSEPEYALWMFKKYGLAMMEELSVAAMTPYTIEREPMEILIAFYERKLEALLPKKGRKNAKRKVTDSSRKYRAKNKNGVGNIR